MYRSFESHKGISIGVIIKKDLRSKGLSQKSLAQIIGMSYRSLNKALNGHRIFHPNEAEKIELFFNYENRFVVRLQTFNLHRKEKNNINITFTPPSIRKCVFWDIDTSTLDWIRHRSFILNRIKEYGNKEEQTAIKNFYSSLPNQES